MKCWKIAQQREPHKDKLNIALFNLKEKRFAPQSEFRKEVRSSSIFGEQQMKNCGMMANLLLLLLCALFASHALCAQNVRKVQFQLIGCERRSDDDAQATMNGRLFEACCRFSYGKGIKTRDTRTHDTHYNIHAHAHIHVGGSKRVPTVSDVT